MGWLDRFRQKSSDAKGATLWPGRETLEVVGESQHQSDLWRIVGAPGSGPVRKPIYAVLLPEPTNQYDPNAIRVVIDGALVGYLPRDKAERYLPGLMRMIGQSDNGLVALAGEIVGGASGRSLGVFLKHEPQDFGITSSGRPESSRPGFRTGFSEAWVTDEGDDSYDMSWLETLPEGPQAIKVLRAMLQTAPDPINRHYMYCELERLLYRNRDAFSSALLEYDEACRQHDSEMDTICPALLTKFGELPLLDLYRQAAIRHQKAKDYASALWWADRGLVVYGQNAALPGVVEDLVKRRDRARAKIGAGSPPPSPPSPPIRPRQ